MRPKARSVGHDDRPGPRNGQLFVHDEKQAVPGPTATLGAATSTRWPTVRIIVDPGVDRAGCHPELSLPAEAVREGGSRDLKNGPADRHVGWGRDVSTRLRTRLRRGRLRST